MYIGVGTLVAILVIVAAVGWSRPALRADLSADVAEAVE